MLFMTDATPESMRTTSMGAFNAAGQPSRVASRSCSRSAPSA